MYLSTAKLEDYSGRVDCPQRTVPEQCGRIRGRDDKAKERSGGPRVHVVPGKLEIFPG
jgi:hypothetical protein